MTIYSIDVMSKIIIINKGEIIAKYKGVVSDILIHKGPFCGVRQVARQLKILMFCIRYWN